MYVIKLDKKYAPYIYKCDADENEYYMLDPYSYSLHASGLPVVGTGFSCLKSCIQQSPRMAYTRSITATEVEYQYCLSCGSDSTHIFEVFSPSTSESNCVSVCRQTYLGYQKIIDAEQNRDYTVCTVCSGDHKYHHEPPNSDEIVSGDFSNIECVSTCENTYHGYYVKEMDGRDVKYCVKCSDEGLYYAGISDED